MRFFSRIRFLIGILFVILLVIGLAVYLDYTMSLAQSQKAQIAANDIAIGTDYSGLVVKQNVEVGDKVQSGQTLFELQSTQLNQDLSTGKVSAQSLSLTVDPTTNNILLKAPANGVVHTIFFQAGSYAPANNIVANIDTADSLYVSAHFRLSPPDYTRLNKDSRMDVRFPDNTVRQAKIYSITLSPNGDAVDTVVKARLPNLDISNFQFAVGTPVSATLHLKQDMWYRSLVKFVENLFRPTGR